MDIRTEVIEMSNPPATSSRPVSSLRAYPSWFLHTFWAAHRLAYRLSRGRLGLWRPKPGHWGTMRLTTIGRRSGQTRVALLGYYEDGPNLVTMAMNGWQAAEPAWWLNLQAHPEATVDLGGERRAVRARAAEGDERARLWTIWGEIDKDLEGYAANRPHETAVVVLEPAPGIA